MRIASSALSRAAVAITVVAVALLGCIALAPSQAQASQMTKNRDMVFKILVDEHGLTPAAACGIMSNINRESEFDPAGTYSEYFGLVQWSDEEQVAMRAFCKSRGLPSDSVVGQTYYICRQLKVEFPSTWKKLKAIPNTKKGCYKAASIYCIEFERPSDMQQEAKMRGKYAQKYYWDKYCNKIGIVAKVKPTFVLQGHDSACGGTVFSCSKLKSVTAKITSANGKRIYFTKTVYPKSKYIYKLKGSKLVKSLKFKSLVKGNYKLTVTARDTKGRTKKVLVSKFEVF